MRENMAVQRGKSNMVRPDWTKNNKKKFKDLSKELIIVLHFLTDYFGYAM